MIITILSNLKSQGLVTNNRHLRDGGKTLLQRRYHGNEKNYFLRGWGLRKVKGILLFFFFLLLLGFLLPKKTFAGCEEFKFSPSVRPLIEGTFDEIIFSVKVSNTSDLYKITSDRYRYYIFEASHLRPDTSGWLPMQIIHGPLHLFRAGDHFFRIEREGHGGDYCPRYEFSVIPPPTPTPVRKYANCRLQAISDPPNKFDSGSNISIIGTGIPVGVGQHRLSIIDGDKREVPLDVGTGGFNISLGTLNDGDYNVFLQLNVPRAGWQNTGCQTWFKSHPTDGGAPTPIPTITPPIPCPVHCQDLIDTGLKDIACAIAECQENCTECGAIAPKPTEVYKICGIIKDPVQQDRCITCIRDRGGMWTALGCLPLDIKGFIEYLLRWGSSIAGGIALLLIIYGGFKILTSAGNPEGIASGKEIIMAALVGLLMIIFAVLILRIIGVDILKIPDFG